mmetsp:Transcript_98148/g.189545  ORF Transcript_98148/g.189545 Transcript_98148/m.189545 type:complete len:82 (-) Transcript_98148:123-368(-)
MCYVSSSEAAENPAPTCDATFRQASDGIMQEYPAQLSRMCGGATVAGSLFRTVHQLLSWRLQLLDKVSSLLAVRPLLWCSI